ncbi:MAG TPA: thiamine pyrophosphate-binding protein [Solirubrobacter sp.]|nr:thiamine pyrophosphate-binding protein [Solirubrobacter sp.]
MTEGTVADAVVAALERAEVDVVFTLCGNHILPLQEAMRRRGLRCVATRSEASAVMAADAYGRIRRRAGVALVTGGPGVANTVGALLTARGNQSPVVLLSGEPGLAVEGRGAQQEADHVRLTAGATKASLRATRADHVLERLREAFVLAETGRTGPVHLTIPVDVQQSPLDGDAPSPRPVPPAPVVPPAFVGAVAERVRAARRPAVIAGAGVWQYGGERAVAALADAGVPVFTLDSARGILPDSAACAFGSADPGLNAAAGQLALADCVIVAGRDADFRIGYGARLASDAVVVHVDLEPGGLGRNLPAGALLAAGDPAAFLGDLAAALADHRAPGEWRERLAAAEPPAVPDAGEDEPLHPASVARAIARAGVAAGAIFALDCGEFVQWCRQLVPAEAPGRWLRLGPQATCGAGLPFGIGAQAALPGAPVLVVAGDGGLGYHVADLETAVRCGLPVVVVVGQDGAWGVEQSLQRGVYGEGAAFTSELSPTDFTGVARGFGVTAVRVAGVAALERELRAALEARAPRLIQVGIRNVPSSGTERLTRAIRAEVQERAPAA